MKQNITLPVLTLGHFCVDFACLYFYFANFPQSGPVTIISSALLYNFLAFALQAPVGYFFDRFPAKCSTFIGILLVLGGYFWGLWHSPVAGLVLCGLGNAFYHVGGSIGIAHTDKKALRDSGIFVSSGALGVSLGTFLANYGIGSATLAILLLLIVLLPLQNLVITPDKQKVSCLPVNTDGILLMLSLFAVFIRSFGGLFFPTLYKDVFSFTQRFTYAVPMLYPFLIAMASGIVAFLGKFLGGFLSCLCAALLQKLFPNKKMDLRSANYIFGTSTLLLSVLFFTLGNSSNRAVLCFLGVLFFHAAMPVTLFELYCILPDRPGFAMGLSTAALFLGYLPYVFFPLDSLPASTILTALTLAATACMVVSLLVYCRAIKRTVKGGSECN